MVATRECTAFRSTRPRKVGEASALSRRIPAALIIPPINNIRHRGLSFACNNAAEYIFFVISHTEPDPELYALQHGNIIS